MRIDISFNIIAAIFFCAASLLSHSVRAADSHPFEVTVYDGYAFGGNFENVQNRRSVQIQPGNAFGFTLSMEALHDSEEFKNAYYELTYRKQNTDLDPPLFGISVENLHLGGRLDFFASNQHIIPYMAMSFGATRFSPSTSTLKDVSKFSLGFGGGVKLPLAKHVAMRFDVRAYMTFVNTDSDAFCRRATEDNPDTPGNESTCVVRWSTGLITQGEGTIGVTIGF